jgi:tetrahydromethanopterin S-methyltransferase subunit B
MMVIRDIAKPEKGADDVQKTLDPTQPISNVEPLVEGVLVRVPEETVSA